MVGTVGLGGGLSPSRGWTIAGSLWVFARVSVGCGCWQVPKAVREGGPEESTELNLGDSGVGSSGKKAGLNQERLSLRFCSLQPHLGHSLWPVPEDADR